MAGLEYDAAEAVRHLRRADPALRTVIDRAGPLTLRPDRSLDVYRALLRSIVYQQLNGNAAATILARMQALFQHDSFPTPGELLATSADTLRSAGVSRNKASAMHDLARHTLDGTVPSMRAARKLGDDELVERLTAVRGVGPWTVHMLLMFRLGRPDVLPVADYGVRAGAQRVYDLPDLPSPAQLRELAEPWRPYRSAACWYLWRAVDLDELPG